MVNEATETIPDRQASQSAGKIRRKRMSRRERRSTSVVIVLTVAAAIAGALAGCHPTGISGLDAAYSAALAALVTAAASRARRSVLLVFAAIGVILSRSWLIAPALACLSVAFGSTFQRRPYRRVNALVGCLGIQVLLRLTPIGFQGFTALAAAVAVLPVVISGWKQCRSRTRRLALIGGGGVVVLAVIFSVPVAISALLARQPVEASVSLAKEALTQVEAGRAPAATAQLRTAATDLTTAHKEVGGWWNLGGYLVPVVAQQERALTRATEAGLTVTKVGAANGPKLDLQALRYQHGRIDLAALEAMASPMKALDSAISSAQRELQSIRSPWLVSPLAQRLGSLSGQVTKAKKSVDLAGLGIKELPAILGADGVRHYFVAFTTPAETRGLGGFIGAYGVLTASDGVINLTASGASIQLSAPGNFRLSGPADYLARYGRFAPQDHFEDLSYSPDLPSVEKAVAQLYPQHGGVPIDGMLVVDPYSLAALLQLTGPISVPGLQTQLTSTNAARVLLQTQYADSSVTYNQRHDLLQTALDTGFHRLTAGSLPSPAKLAKVLNPMVRQGRLLFDTSHRADQPLLARLGLQGAFPDPSRSSDVLAVTVANAGNNKIDSYLHQAVSDSVSYDPATGRVKATVTISLTNDAPSSGLPRALIGNYTDGQLAEGTSYLWVSLYSRMKIANSTTDGEPSQFSKGVFESGSTAYSTYVVIPSKSTSVVKLNLIGQTLPESAYDLTIRLQPLANPQSLSVDVSPTAGWYRSIGAPSSWTAGTAEIQRHRWRFARS